MCTLKSQAHLPLASYFNVRKLLPALMRLSQGSHHKLQTSLGTKGMPGQHELHNERPHLKNQGLGCILAVKRLLSRHKVLGLMPVTVTEENNSPKVTSDTQSHMAGVLT